MSRPTTITVDLQAIRVNCSFAQSLAGNAKLMAVIKADAYGHGAIAVAQALASQVDLFTVSCLEEALHLRNQGIKEPILLLEGCFSPLELVVAANNALQIVIHSHQQLTQLIEANISVPLTVWLKIDSGMHRLGISGNECMAFYQQLKQVTNVKDIVLMTHLASADQPQNAMTDRQIAYFKHSIEKTLALYPHTKQSIANSAALMAWPQSQADWARPGIMLYGISPFAQPRHSEAYLVPAMTFSSKVIAIRQVDTGEAVGYGNTWVAAQPSVIATVAVGYGDGYPRGAKNGTPVLVNGQRAKLAGRVSMDMISLDVTQIDGVNIGDDVELWGKQLPVNEVANWSDTIGYELVTRMPTRARRIYIN
ncbi:MAG: alanine racemase [Paraglaciecola sp.]|jgi:alanine racemase